MCNDKLINQLFGTIILLSLLGGCGIKWATNKVLSNPDAIEKVGAVYDVLTPRDTTERLVFIQGDSIVIEHTDTLRVVKDSITTDTIRIRTVKNILRVDTIIKQLPPDNRAMARLLDSLGKYTNELNQARGNLTAKDEALKTANNRLFWMAGIILVLGTVIGLLIKFKVKL